MILIILFVETKNTFAAVVNYAPEKGSVEIREITRPEIGEEDVLLEVVNVFFVSMKRII